MMIRLLLLASALVLPVTAQTAPGVPAATPTPAQTPAKEAFQLQVARNDREVILTWNLPKAEIKQFEIMRGIRPEAAGRGRVAAVRTEPAVYYDSVPDSAATYWYWLKITFVGGHVMNVGPVPTPESKVWSP